jgi:hypothetical protein
MLGFLEEAEQNSQRNDENGEAQSDTDTNADRNFVEAAALGAADDLNLFFCQFKWRTLFGRLKQLIQRHI